MKTAGIIGGIGPESSIEYYRQIIASYRSQRPDGHYPQLIINSIDMKTMLDLIGAGRMEEVTAYLSGEIERLACAGADFALLASNTPHIVFDALSRRSPMPLISIVEAACRSVKFRGLERVGLFGTRFTMQGGFYREGLKQYDISLILPTDEEQSYIHEVYMGELVNGIIREETRARLISIAERLRDEAGIEGLILGGTELPLILRASDEPGIPFFDTTKIHVEEVVRRLVEE